MKFRLQKKDVKYVPAALLNSAVVYEELHGNPS